MLHFLYIFIVIMILSFLSTLFVGMLLKRRLKIIEKNFCDLLYVESEETLYKLWNIMCPLEKTTLFFGAIMALPFTCLLVAVSGLKNYFFNAND